MEGIMRPTRQDNQDIKAYIRDVLGPATGKRMSVSEHLEHLDPQSLKQVMQIAQLVKAAMLYQSEPIGWHDLAKKLYPKFGHYRLAIIGEMLQEADPITLPPAKPKADVLERPASETQSFTGLGRKPQQHQQSDDRTATTAEDNPTIAGDMAGLMSRLAISESSNNPNAEITLKDGRRFVGLLQFGEARLKDYQAATGKKFTQDEFKTDPALQDDVAQWHFKDIDKAIDALGDEAKGYDRDGLRSVAHLGGKGGMRKFVKSGGKHNPEDELGTSLRNYYDRFSEV
jgi:hypothetical protein